VRISSWLALALAGSLLQPLAAQPTDPTLALRRVGQLLRQQQYQQLVELVVADPARAEAVFRAALQQGARRPQWLNAQKASLNSLATIFDKRLGRPEFARQLQEMGFRAVDVPLSSYLQGMAGPSQQLGPLDQSLRAGNYKNALRLLEQLQRPESLFWVLRVVALESSGQWHRALGEAQTVLDRVGPQDPQRLYALMALLASARACQQPAWMEKYRPELLQLCQADPGPSGRLARFTLESWSRPAGEQITRAALLEAHKRVWALFPSPALDGIRPGEARWACAAARDWIRDLASQARLLDPKSSAYQELLHEIESDLHRLYAQVEADKRDSRDLQLEFVFGISDAALDAVDALISTGRYAEAEHYLRCIAPFVALAQASLRNFEKKLQARAPLLGSEPPVALAEGEFSRCLSRFHQTWARLLLARSGDSPSPSDADLLRKNLEKAGQFEDTAHRGIGFRGLEEVAFDRAEALLRYSPQQAIEPLAQLVSRCRTLGYSSGLIQALAWQARLQRENPALARPLLEEARTLLETGVVGDGGLAARWRFRNSVIQVYEQLALLDFGAGKPEQAFRNLNQGKQLEALGQSEEVRKRGQQIAALQQEVVQLQQHQGQDPVTQQQLAASKEEFVALARRLRSSESAVNPLDLTRFQTLLPGGTLVLQILPGAQETYLLSVTSQSFRAYQVKLGESELGKKISHCRNSIGKMNQAATEADLEELYRLLLGPLQKELDQAKVLVVVPSGRLHYLPFQALGRKQDGKFTYLIERMPVVVLSKSSDFLCLAQPLPALKGSMVAIGNPDGTLPGAEVEARQVAGLFSPAQLYTGPAAVTERLQSMPAGVEFLHLATHGFLNAQNPEASYLVMAEGARLDPQQIVRLPLSQARLVTLSACQTAVGENSPGREVTSLAESFWAAGSAHTAYLGSLWQVADESTRLLMVALYRGVREQKLPLGEAFRQAQLQLLSSPQTRQPFHWAAFTLWGDWR
jgi:CHAT domain-containing protein